MMKLSWLVFALLLSSCTLGSQSLEFPTPTLNAVLPTVAPTFETPGTAAVAEATSTQISAAEDPFAANVLHLPAPDCTKTTPLQTEGPYYSPGSPERKADRGGIRAGPELPADPRRVAGLLAGGCEWRV